MAVLDVARGRAAWPVAVRKRDEPRDGRPATKTLYGALSRSVGTLVALMLIAVGVLALRFILVLAHGMVQ